MYMTSYILRIFYYATLKSIEQYVAYDFGLKSSVVVRINLVSLDIPITDC